MPKYFESSSAEYQHRLRKMQKTFAVEFQAFSRRTLILIVLTDAHIHRNHKNQHFNQRLPNLTQDFSRFLERNSVPFYEISYNCKRYSQNILQLHTIITVSVKIFKNFKTIGKLLHFDMNKCF